MPLNGGRMMNLNEIHPQATCEHCTHHTEMPGRDNIVYCKQFCATMPNDGWCCYGKEEKKCNSEI